MKILLLIICLFFFLPATAQESFNISIHQDTKLIFVGDNRGNHRGTIDVTVKAEIPLVNFPKSYIFIFPSYEYAELLGGTFRRYAVGVGYTIKGVYFKNFNIGLFPSIGYVYRENTASLSFGFGIDISYRLTKRFSLSYVHQIIERTDLKLIYNENSYTRSSSFVGFKIHL